MARSFAPILILDRSAMKNWTHFQIDSSNEPNSCLVFDKLFTNDIETSVHLSQSSRTKEIQWIFTRTDGRELFTTCSSRESINMGENAFGFLTLDARRGESRDAQTSFLDKRPERSLVDPDKPIRKGRRTKSFSSPGGDGFVLRAKSNRRSSAAFFLCDISFQVLYNEEATTSKNNEK